MSNRPRARPSRSVAVRSQGAAHAATSHAGGRSPLVWVLAVVGLIVIVAVVAVVVTRSSGSDVAAPPVLTGAALEGQQLAQQRGCVSCHTSTGEVSEGPTWKGIYGQPVTLTDGTTVTVDADYLKRSIREPSAQIADGYVSKMPTAVPPLTDAEIAAVVAYIEALR